MTPSDSLFTSSQEEELFLIEAKNRAHILLRSCVGPYGLYASSERDGYRNLWTRDAMIAGLGVLSLSDPILLKALRVSITTIAKHQTQLGLIPNKIDFEPQMRVNYRAYGDSGLWFVIVSCLYFEKTGDTSLARSLYPALRKTVSFYEHQDVDASGLISIQEASEWKDLFAVRGKGLYVNVLFVMACNKLALLAKQLGKLDDALYLKERAETTRARINQRLWYTESKPLAEIVADSFSTSTYGIDNKDSLGRQLLLPKKTMLQKESYYLPYVTHRDFGEWFDSFGNILAILGGVADGAKAHAILDFVHQYNLAHPFPIRAVYPTLREGDKDWRYYYTFGDLNLPDHYHNGGIWPFVGGAFVASLAQAGREDAAQSALLALAQANKNGQDSEWEFREWHHGKKHTPSGMYGQAWSAGMYLFAHNALKRGSGTEGELRSIL